MGLDPRGFEVLLNDLDADTVLACWLLRHHRRWSIASHRERVRRLVNVVAEADAHGPAYPVGQYDLLNHFHAVILAPIRQHRSGGYPGGAPAALATALDALDAWWNEGLVPSAAYGPGGPPPRLRHHGIWLFAEAAPGVPGASASLIPTLYRLGFDRVVASSARSNGLYDYLIAKRSDLVAGFPVSAILSHLDEAERDARGGRSGGSWGGGSSLGGGIACLAE